MKTKIASVETFPINYPVAGRFKFFENPAGRPMGRPAVVIKITADDGTVGWGQGIPSPRWSYETLETVHSTITRYLAPELIGLDPRDTDIIRDAMNRAIAPSFSTGQPICKAGIDLALFDLTGRLLQQSAAERWSSPTKGSAQVPDGLAKHVEQPAGQNVPAFLESPLTHPAGTLSPSEGERAGARGPSAQMQPGDGSSIARPPVTLSWTLNPRSLDEIEGLIQQAHVRGYRHFNVKIAPDLKFDVELCRQIKRLATEAVLWADANGGYDTETALAVAPKLADLGVAFFEQPVAANRLSGFAALKRQGALPIIMDEGIVSLTDLEEFHRLKLLDGVALKVVRCGGLTEARKVVEFVLDNGLLFLGSGLTDPDLSLAATLSLYSAYGLQYPAALNGPQFLTASILKEPFAPVNGQLSPPTGAGLGVEVDEAKLAALRLAEVL